MSVFHQFRPVSDEATRRRAVLERCNGAWAVLGRIPQHVGQPLVAELREKLTVDLSVAGGLKLDNLPAIIEHCPDIVVVGGGITSSDHPESVAGKTLNFMRRKS